MFKKLLKIWYKIKFDMTVAKISRRYGHDYAVGYVAARNGTSIDQLCKEAMDMSRFLDIDIRELIQGHAMYHVHNEDGRYG